MIRLPRLVAILLAFALIAAACGNDDDDQLAAPTPAATPAATAEPTEAAAPTPDPTAQPVVPAPTGPTCDWPMWGHGIDRTFSYPCDSGINPDTAASLRRIWYFNTSDVVTAAPVVVDGTLYVGDWAGRFYALDAADGTELWHYDSEYHDNVYAGQITSSASYTVINGTPAVVFNAGRTIHALNAADGTVIWTHARGEPGWPTEFETTPIVVEDRVIATFDTHNAPFPAGVVAVSLATGEELWHFDLEGGDHRGCGGVWGSPSVDLERRLMFAGSANCPTSPDGWGPYTEALFAVNIDTGEPAWSFQPHPPNNDDSDFAGVPVLFSANGQDLVGLGNKDAVFYVVNRDTGELVWSTRATADNVIRPNFSSGGFIGPAAYADGIIAGGTGVADCPCMHAFDAATGDIVWQQQAVGPTYSPTTEVSGVVFVGSLDFTLRALRLDDGEVLWSDELTGLISGGVAIVGDDMWAVAGFREPGSAGPSETSGVFRYTVAPDVEAAEQTAPEEEPEPEAGQVRLVGASGRCIDAPCDVGFDFKTPPPGTDPQLTLSIQTDPFELTVTSSGLGDPAAWLREGSDAAAVGASAYGVLVSERDDRPSGGYLCVLDDQGGCTARTVPRPGASYNRISLLALNDTTTIPGPADGFDRLVASIGFNPPLQTEPLDPPTYLVFSPQGNNLVVYGDNGGIQRLITNAREDPNGRDINGQVCFTDDGRFIAGEDTGQPEIPAGFGIFDLDGDSLGTLSAIQVGKLTPDFESADSQPEPYGCAFLPDGRLLTTDVGNQASGPGTGQLTVWFPPYDGARCVVADYIATAQQLAADGDDVLLASARAPTIGVQRFSNLPRSADECDPDAVTVELFIAVGDGVSLTTGIAADGRGGWYVSDTLTGVINQYDGDGNYLRTVLAPPEGEGLGLEPISTGSPLGIAVGPDGTLYYADLALALNDGNIGPTGGQGTVRRIRFDADNQPMAPETIDYGLNFPDGLGVLPIP
ncbi:MAG: PQQ-binding-like beta-propeller repeat protein [bacterium]|nr:PQQ-binding-like beta-propeller repeat protein [bacterium]